MNTRSWLRAGVAFLAVIQGVTGATQLFAPRFFYDNVPTSVHPWVSLFPPYNEHLMRDIGAATLAYVLVLGIAAVTLDRLVIRTALVANLIFTVPHFIFHAFHLEDFSTGDAVGQTISLAVGVLLPAACLALTRPAPAHANALPPNPGEPEP